MINKKIKRKRYRNPIMPSEKVIFCYLFIPVAVYLFIKIIPLFSAGYYSFFNWSGGPVKTFVGIQNYIDVFQDRVFWLAFKNTVVFTILMVVGQVGIAFLFTLLFTMKWVKFKEFHRRIMYLPSVISAVVIGLMWQMIFNKDYGLLNQLLKVVGLDEWIRLWLDDPKIAMYALSVPIIWQWAGYYLALLMGAVAAIPKDVLEVAEVDGATGLQRSLHITIPLIWDTLKICLMLCLSGSFKAFDHIMVLTGGGPGRATTVLALYNYDVSFTQMRLGYACAMALIIMVMTMLLTVGSKALMGRGGTYD